MGGLNNKHIFLALLLFITDLQHYFCLFITSNLADHFDDDDDDISSFNRTHFPTAFIFGTGSSSYQYEGGASEGGRGLSIWDTFSHIPGKIVDGSNGDVALDSYHRYKEDVKIMKEMGLDAYRFSISWSRILPRGKVALGVNNEGIRYYNNLINELLANGIEPFVTIFHFDLPQVLEEEYGGFQSPRIVNDFRDYTEVCFQSFGDRVKHWITINEPLTYSVAGYVLGISAPGRCSDWERLDCTGGDSATEPYLVSHHQLLAHATSVQLYRQNFQASQKGSIGITLNTHWGIPYSDSTQDKNAASRFVDFMLGWFIEPLTFGEYPHVMRCLVGKRLPKFTAEQAKLVKGSFDFLGLNYYTSYYIADAGHQYSTRQSYSTDSRTNALTSRNGIPIGPQAGSNWLFVYPKGLKDLLLYTKEEYNDPIIYITENGMDETNNDSLSLHEALFDPLRISYYNQHLQVLKESISRRSFPVGFIFGAASSAYQYEGGATGGGKGPSIWDTYTHKYPGKIADGSNGDVALDSYNRYKEDVKIMKDMGLDAYRFSMSWPRILPKGKASKGVNKEGIRYYNNLINELLANGIQPFVTLFHWDVPQVLEDEYGGFLSSHIVNDFRDYVEVCFRNFGDRVKHWITLNEPYTFSVGGYAAGFLAPGRCSNWLPLNCTGGDSATEPYLVSHYMLLAHAAAVQLYKHKFQESQKGLIGITLISEWTIPYSGAPRDKDAAFRSLDFAFGWFMDPLTFGEYPHSMRTIVGKRLPKFTEEESKLVKGSFDFVGLNYYTTTYSAYAGHQANTRPSYVTDSQVNQSSSRNGVPIGPKAASDWLYVYPKGLKDVLIYTKIKYNNPVIYITENGIDEANNGSLTLTEALADPMRIDYHHHHLRYLNEAIKDGVNVKGYFAWSLLDDFEWNSGYTVRFGINFVDFKDGLKRYPKLSAHWFRSFLAN